MKRPKVLLSAFSCAPNRGSEPGVGWNWALQAARYHDVWVLTSRWDHEAIPREAYADIPNLKFIYVSVPFWPRRWFRERTLRLYYLLWQVSVLPVAYFKNRRIRFDIVHHLTLNTVEVPGLLWLLAPPFIWGPVGGAQLPPRSLRRYFGASWTSEIVRALRKYAVKLNPIVRLALRKSALVLTANADTERLLVATGAKCVQRETEAGVDANFTSATRQPAEHAQFNIVWVGRLIPRKGPLLAIDVMAELQKRGVSATLFMIGTGPQQAELETRIEQLGLVDSVQLTGQVAHTEIAEYYALGDVFLFSSLHDTSGNVMLEAMIQGLPVIALDHQGAAELVNDDCGIKVAIGNERSVINGLADAIQRMTEDETLRLQMGRAARQRVAQRFTWDYKGPLLQQIYRQARADS